MIAQACACCLIEGERQLSSSSVNPAACAFKFFYGTVLGLDLRQFDVPIAHVPQQVPDLLSRQKAALLLAHAPHATASTLLRLAYATDLRLPAAIPHPHSQHRCPPAALTLHSPVSGRRGGQVQRGLPAATSTATLIKIGGAADKRFSLTELTGPESTFDKPIPIRSKEIQMHIATKSLLALSIAILFAGCGGGGSAAGTCLYPLSSCAADAGDQADSQQNDNYVKSGTGDNTFELPARSMKVRIQASTSANSSNFMVDVAGQNLVNELVGAAYNPATFDGTYIIPAGGIVEITRSSGVAWTFTEVP